MHQSFPLLISSLCAGGVFLAAFLLLTDLIRDNQLANRWLGAFFLTLCFLFIQLVLEQTCRSDRHLIYITELPRWAIFPCLYMTVISFAHSKKPSPIAIHFLPSALFIAITLMDGQNLPWWMTFIIRYFFFAQGLLYGFLNLRILHSHKRRIREVMADNDSDLNWLRRLVYAPVVMAIVWLAFRKLPSMDSILYVICLALILYFISAALRQRAVYPKEVASITDEPKQSSTSQRLTSPQIDLLKQRVASLVDQNKPYLDPALNLKMLADQVGMNTHELSLVLNQGFGMNFYSYINALRAEEAVKLLASGDYGRGDMEVIAFRAGFNSRTTFYATMKKLKKMNPTGLLNSTDENIS